MADDDDKLVARGSWGEVRYAARRNKRLPAEEYYLSLEKQYRAKLNALFLRMANAGRISNRRKFKQVDGDIFEFKSKKSRISCYRSGSRWNLLHGFSKDGDDWPEGELTQAQNLLVEHRGY